MRLPAGVTTLLDQIESDSVDIDAMLAANPMGGPTSTNPGLTGGFNGSGGGAGSSSGPMPDFNKLIEDQQARMPSPPQMLRKRQSG